MNIFNFIENFIEVHFTLKLKFKKKHILITLETKFHMSNEIS